MEAVEGGGWCHLSEAALNPRVNMQVHWALDDDDDDVGGAGQWSGHGSDHSDDVSFPKSFSSTSALTSVISSDLI